MITAADLTIYLDQYLRTREIRDDSLNGLQVQGRTEINKIGFAVDACLASFLQAKAAGVDFLIVHHGLFWGRELPLTGSHFIRVKTLIESGTNLYCSHLPLDVHPEVGNNVQLAEALGLQVEYFFGEYKGTPIAVYSRSEGKWTADELLIKLRKILGDHVRVDKNGPEKFRNIGICTGAGAAFLPEARSIGIEAYVTGEPRHSFYHYALEENIHTFFGRHYDTETLGLKALARHLEETFELDTTFIDVPTAM